MKLLQVDPETERRQAEAVARVRQARDRRAWQDACAAVESAARSGTNLVPPIVTAVEAHATVGEIADVLRGVFGEYRGH
jgi:methylmalonyl-CoA mutase N-terminal domain/subunit